MLLALLVAAAASTPPIAPLTNEFDSKGMTSLSFGFGVPSLPGSASVPGTTSPFAGPLLTLAPIVGASYFISDGTAIRAEFGFDAILSSGGGPAALTLGVGVRMYQLKRNHVAVFLQPSVVLARYRTVAAGVLDAAQALTFAAGAGVEYLFTDRFSVGGTLALAFTIGNIGGPAGSSSTTGLNTGTSGLSANFYF